MLGVSRYEIPLDGRNIGWMNLSLGLNIDPKHVSTRKSYEAVLDFVKELCIQSDVLPVVFDVVAFRKGKDDGGRAPRKTRGTTIPGYKNRNGQVVVWNTELPGTDHLQFIYKLGCSNCGAVYGANGSDIHDRKCPECQGGASGLEIAKKALSANWGVSR